MSTLLRRRRFLRVREPEEKRAGGEGVSQEQLAFYDLLSGVEVTLSAKDQSAVKKVATALPKLVERKLVIDWRRSQMRPRSPWCTSTCTSRTGAMGKACT